MSHHQPLRGLVHLIEVLVAVRAQEPPTGNQFGGWLARATQTSEYMVADKNMEQTKKQTQTNTTQETTTLNTKQPITKHNNNKLMVAAMRPLLRQALSKRRAAPLRMPTMSSCICIGNAAELQNTAEINSAQ